MNENQNVKNEEYSEDIYHVLSNLVDEIVADTAPSNSLQTPITTVPKSSYHKHVIAERSQRLQEENRRESKPTFEIYRATIEQFSESQSDLEMGTCMPRLNDVLRNKVTQTPCVPPSYSTVIKQGRPSLDIRRDVRSMEVQHISPFARVPPPSYAEIHGVWSREMSNASSEQVLLGPEPIYIWCTRCATVVITVTQSQRSRFTHLTAAALCLFGCWPCAMLPYCMNSCNNIYHFCPDCNYLFGMYRPW